MDSYGRPAIAEWVASLPDAQCVLVNDVIEPGDAMSEESLRIANARAEKGLDPEGNCLLSVAAGAAADRRGHARKDTRFRFTLDRDGLWRVRVTAHGRRIQRELRTPEVEAALTWDQTKGLPMSKLNLKIDLRDPGWEDVPGKPGSHDTPETRVGRKRSGQTVCSRSGGLSKSRRLALYREIQRRQQQQAATVGI